MIIIYSKGDHRLCRKCCKEKVHTEFLECKGIFIIFKRLLINSEGLYIENTEFILGKAPIVSWAIFG